MMRNLGWLETSVAGRHEDCPVYNGVHENEDMRNRVEQREPKRMGVVPVASAARGQEGVDEPIAKLVAMALGRIFG